MGHAEPGRQDLGPATPGELHPAGGKPEPAQRQANQGGERLAQLLGSADHRSEESLEKRQQHAGAEAQLSADVAALAARADASPPTATSTLTRRSTNSLANAGNNP